ncbi:DUF2200 domain-containing protein [Corynebacterium hylobatis]|uniref:DUF2200 domain-containing protein n=1 Tax=Corynebacterium hylobatis TaxID=1859290 RepID=A0A3S0HIF0_9CORY|nr:DUF2200 domain-containing protein [Corynebacterium hylobatis]RSZ64693.1 DUF2200 domain-containing protein [Corynebacterium hylobatis]
MSERLFSYSFAEIHRLYVNKVERKGRTVEELDEVISWLTGYTAKELRSFEGDLREFFAAAPAMNDNTGLITGVICGVRVEDIEDPLMQQVRWMDKLVDELARGKKMANILRG